MHYPSLSSASKAQKEFYKRFENGINQGIKIDIEGNISYVFVYLYKLIKKGVKNLNVEEPIDKLKIINNFYGNYETISYYTCSWMMDFYLSYEDFEKAWKALSQYDTNISLEDLIQLRKNCKETYLTADILFKLPKSYTGITEYGKQNFSEMLQLVDIFLKDFSLEKGRNHVEYFLNKFDYGNLAKEDINELKSFFPNHTDFLFWEKDYVETQQSNRPYPKRYHHCFFTGVTMDLEKNLGFLVRETIPYIISCALTNELKRIVKEAEHTIRAERHLPSVIEWWANEAELFYKLTDHYKNERIVHHGKPHWIKRQHLDIYFLEKNIAIEYVDVVYRRFSKKNETIITQQKIDKKKEKLCKQNNCTLIHIYKNYNFNDVITQLNKLL